jgi:hypothetical protein
VGVALFFTGVAVVIFFISQTTMAFVAGDKVRLSMNPKLGPFTLEKCYLEDSQQVCKLKEAGYMVNATYLRAHDPKKPVAIQGEAGPSSTVSVQVINR